MSRHVRAHVGKKRSQKTEKEHTIHGTYPGMMSNGPQIVDLARNVSMSLAGRKSLKNHL